MTEEQKRDKWIAGQLRQPNGPHAADVGNLMNKGNRVLNQRVIEQLDPKENSKVLELGMGNGAFIEEILDNYPSINYYGFDFSEKMVEEAKERNEFEENISIAKADAHNMPVRDGVIDLLFTVNTIYFWDDEKRVLDEFYRVLKPGGKLIIGMRPKRTLELYGFTEFNVNLFETDNVLQMLKSTGFNITEVLDEPEPEEDIDGETVQLDSLIIKAIKN